MAQKIKKYQKDFSYSYCIGAFPCLELLEKRPQEVLEVVLSSTGETNEGVKKIKTLTNGLGIKTSVNDHLVEEISGKQNAYVVIVFRKFESPVLQDETHLVLVNPSDAGNLGTIMRTALAFDIQNLVIIKPAVDQFDPKVVRASMGAIFQMNMTTFDSFESYLKKFPRVVYVFSPDGEIELGEVRFEQPTALVFGTESAGVPTEIKNEGKTVRILQSNRVDSLNLPISIGVVLYKFCTSRDGR